MKCFTFFFALLWIGFLAAQVGTEALRDNLDSLVRNKLISVNIQGLGGHSGESVEMELKNLSSKTQKIEVGAGRRLVSLDSGEQDLLVVKDKTALLTAGATIKLLLTAFCCEMHRHSPKQEALFQMGSMVTGSWKKLILLLKKNHYNNSTIQEAVWGISDKRSVSGIHEEGNPKIKELREFIAKENNEVIPWYNTTYAATPQPARTTAGVTHTPVPAGSDRVQKVTGYLDYELTSNAAITVKIVNDRGIVMATIVEDRPALAAKHKCQIDLEVYSWPKGDYKVQVWKDGGFLKEAVIRL